LANDLDFDESDGLKEEETDEEVLIPSSWNQDFSTSMIVNVRHDSAW
jgi:hypothetical protein